jgi:molecular chaperone GrpE (heat shock protein)
LQTFSEFGEDCELEKIKDKTDEKAKEIQAANLQKSWSALEKSFSRFQGSYKSVIVKFRNSSNADKESVWEHTVLLGEVVAGISGFEKSDINFNNTDKSYLYAKLKKCESDLERKDETIAQMKEEILNLKHEARIKELEAKNDNITTTLLREAMPHVSGILGAFMGKTANVAVAGGNLPFPPQQAETDSVEAQMQLLQKQFASNLTTHQVAQCVTNIFIELARQVPEKNPFEFAEKMLKFIEHNPMAKTTLLTMLYPNTTKNEA